VTNTPTLSVYRMPHGSLDGPAAPPMRSPQWANREVTRVRCGMRGGRRAVELCDAKEGLKKICGLVRMWAARAVAGV
jgi:hypothetical protein